MNAIFNLGLTVNDTNIESPASILLNFGSILFSLAGIILLIASLKYKKLRNGAISVIILAIVLYIFSGKW